MKKLGEQILSLLLAFGLCVSLCVSGASASNEQEFTDVSSSAWYYESVQYVAKNNLMVGTGESVFEPNANLTRGMFVTILGRMAGINTDEYTSSAFTDVKAGAWYSSYVSWAASNGIVSGYGNDCFGVNDPITREQMATIIARYLTAAEITLQQADDAVSAFHDAASVSSWAVEGLELMRQTAIIVGDDQGNFNPASTATRAQAATIFMRLKQAIEKQQETEPTPSTSNQPEPTPTASSQPEPTPSVSNEDIQIETSYGIMTYPYAFQEILTYEREDSANGENYIFYAVLDSERMEIYSISFSDKVLTDHGTQLGVLKNTSDEVIYVYLAIEDINTDGLSKDDRNAVYAAQETLNDVVASLDNLLEVPEPSASPLPTESTSPTPVPSESVNPSESPAPSESVSPSPNPSEEPVPSETPAPNVSNQDICVETSYGDLYYPYAFGDVMTYEKEDDGSIESYDFYAVLNGVKQKAYTFAFSPEGMACDGVLIGTVKGSSDEEVRVYLILEELDSSKIAEDDLSTFYAVQETLNDVLASLENVSSFTAA